MRLIVNGETCETASTSLPALLAELGADAGRVAVVVNNRVIPTAERHECVLAAGDAVDLLTFAGGG
jgi:thiamine biosynthesis protein ThiS